MPHCCLVFRDEYGRMSTHVSLADLSALSAQADAIELSSFSGSQASIVEEGVASLRDASKSVAELLPKFQGAVSTRQWEPLLTTIGLTVVPNIGVAIYFFTRPGDPLAPKATQTLGSAPSPAAPTSTSKPTEWFLNTVPGTSVKDFKSWILQLPDKGAGIQYIYDGANYQGYTGKWTLEEALVIHQDPHVDQQLPNQPVKRHAHFMAQQNTLAVMHSSIKRANPNVITSDPHSELYLKFLSYPKYRDLKDLDSSDHLYDYTFERSLGDGTYIYMFDSGVDYSHPVR